MNISYMRIARLDSSGMFQRNFPSQLKLCSGEANPRITAGFEGTPRTEPSSWAKPGLAKLQRQAELREGGEQQR